MQLLIDAGNSRLKWAVVPEQGETLTVNARLYQYTDRLEDVKDILSCYQINSLLMVHVLGDAFESRVTQYCQKEKIPSQLVQSVAFCCGVSNGYERAGQLGADRFVALIAAHHRFPRHNVIIVDCGTAVTIDALTSDGQHLGGLIMPGLQLSTNTLIKNTRLRVTPGYQQPRLLATNTHDAITSGSIYGLSGAIRHVSSLLNNTVFTRPAKIVLCGGDSAVVASHLAGHTHYKKDKDMEVVPELVMEGLTIINETENA